MSYIKEDLKCPNCKHKNRIKIYKELNESNKDAILSKEIFTFICSNCGERVTGLYDTSYITDKFHLYFRTKQEDIKDDFKLSRVCYSFEDFKEKICIFDDNLNDIVINFIKCYLRDTLEEQIEDIRYSGKNDESIIFYLIGPNKYVGFSFEDYRSLIKNSKMKEPTGCTLVDLLTFRNYFELR